MLPHDHFEVVHAIVDGTKEFSVTAGDTRAQRLPAASAMGHATSLKPTAQVRIYNSASTIKIDVSNGSHPAGVFASTT